VAATLVEGGSDTEVQFIVPDGVSFTAAKEVALTALYNGGNPVDFGKVTVYPFYYWKDVVLGVGDKSNHDKAFFVPDMGGVISAEEWSDPYAGTVTTANTLPKDKLTAEQYYSVKPYIFATSGSNMAFICPTNSSSQLKNMKKEDGTDVVGGKSIFGTPIVAYRNMEYDGATESETGWAAKVKSGDISSLTDELPDKRASSGGPKFTLSNPANNGFAIGSVLLVQYITYECGQLKTSSNSEIRNTGFIYVKSINPEPTSASNLPKTSTITMDVYWSKPMN
jgi:hypothetical protein